MNVVSLVSLMFWQLSILAGSQAFSSEIGRSDCDMVGRTRSRWSHSNK